MTAEAESPESFIYWAGLSAISAVMKKRVFLDKFYYKLYPNIYVMLVAPSGGRKGFPLWLARALVSKTGNYRIISGRSSIEAIIKELATTQTDGSGKPPITEASAFIASSEFAAALVGNPQALTILTDLYDTHSHEDGWHNSLKGTGTETLKHVCITMLSASNETHLMESIPDSDIKGGFVGRTIMVKEDKRRIINSLINPPTIKMDINKLLPHLQAISSLSGQFHYTQAGAKTFDDWYTDFSTRLDAGQINDDTGTADRLNDQILKISMLLSLAEGVSLELDKHHIEEAIRLCTVSTTNVRSIVNGQGKSMFGRGIKLIIAALLKRAPAFEVTRTSLLQTYWGEFGHAELDIMVETLRQAGAITIHAKGNESVYRLTPKLLDQYRANQGKP